MSWLPKESGLQGGDLLQCWVFCLRDRREQMNLERLGSFVVDKGPGKRASPPWCPGGQG